MATDTIEKLRALALEGIADAPVVEITSVRRRRRDDGLAPAIPAWAETPTREPLTRMLFDGAALEWRRAAHAWVPSLERVVAQGVVEVVVRGRNVDAVMRNGSQRARSLPAPWVAVVVAAITGRELPAVRRALRSGQTRFTPEAAL